MRKPKAPTTRAVTVDDVEAAFYEALQNGDLDKLKHCWGDDDHLIATNVYHPTAKLAHGCPSRQPGSKN